MAEFLFDINMKPIVKMTIDEAEFLEMVKKGTKAWSDVDDPAQWVDELRGNDGDE